LKAEDIKILVNYRLAEAREAIKDADCLIAADRSAQGIINRLYYAMFYAGLAILQRLGKTPSKHSGVISLIDTHYVITGKIPKQLSKAFHRAFEMRQSSDYQASSSVPPDTITDLRKEAELFVNAASELIANESDDVSV
jgi:uncharacterized protein (UPF0332 family)